jgi:hypothetical protein
MTSSRTVKTTTTRRPKSGPYKIKRGSPYGRRVSSAANDSSVNTQWASSKSRPCLAQLLKRLFSSHVNSMSGIVCTIGVYVERGNGFHRRDELMDVMACQELGGLS